MKVVDISKYNTVTDWNAVSQNVDGVIIRCGYRGYVAGVISEDNKFRMFAEQCRAAGIPFGVYFMSQAITEAEAREEADYAVNMANAYGATLPIFIDSEDGDGTAINVRADGLSQDVRTAVVKAFCDQVQARGCITGVYASESWFRSRMHYEQLTAYRIWCAKYGTNDGTAQTKPALNKVDMWQYSSRGSVPGVSGNVDVNECYFDIQTVEKPIHTATLEVTDTNVDATYRVAVKDKKTGVVRWLPEVKNLLDYAGLNESSVIVAIMAKVSQGEMRLQAHVKGRGWYDIVTGYDVNDKVNGFAGDLVNEIDAVMCYYVTPEVLRNATGYKKAKYSVSTVGNSGFYSWQYDNETCVGPDGQKQDGYAGIYGKSIDGLYLCIE
ncbi:MAG: glycoside hydrolase family 25 protein [Lachnospiraceae bacterium]|nr:glycoside hydrolase family 25 protein [Lachnospiraceae bacterium]